MLTYLTPDLVFVGNVWIDPHTGAPEGINPEFAFAPGLCARTGIMRLVARDPWPGIHLVVHNHLKISRSDKCKLAMDYNHRIPILTHLQKVGSLCFLKFPLGDWGQAMTWESKHLLVGGFRSFVFDFKHIWDDPQWHDAYFWDYIISWGHQCDFADRNIKWVGEKLLGYGTHSEISKP